ncbi:MAG TPA: tyrosine--tRNA ligase [Puia sp.]
MNLITELTWRGMIQDIMSGTEQQLEKEMTTGYIGFDPTADSLHVGSLVPILLLVHLQKAGHKPIALVGGATGMVGDPSGKSAERNLLDDATLNHNLQGIKTQLSRYLDFTSASPNAAEMVNNYDWFKGLTFLQFIRDVGKHITVNYMSAKDSVKKRLEGENGMSFTEFTYQLVQGYDFYWLYVNKNSKLQMGGSDQWGNITTGTELIRRKAGGEAFAFTCPLITKADGTKFGKSEKGNIWLDPAKTSYFDFYQFWLNAADADAEKWIKIFTFLGRQEIETLIDRHRQHPEQRLLQKALAREITVFVHGAEPYDQIISTSKGFYSGDPIEFINSSSDSALLNSGVSSAISGSNLPVDAVTFLAESGSTFFSSKGEARKMIQQGGVSINEIKITDPKTIIDNSYLLKDKYILIRKGKNFHIVISKDKVE